jgi:hypothetical protein
MNKLFYLFYGLVSLMMITLFGLPSLAFAAYISGSTEGFGELAEQLNQGPVSGLKNFFYSLCYIIGVLIIYRGYQLYQAHRSLPGTCSLWSAVYMTTAGFVILLVPLAHYLIDKF